MTRKILMAIPLVAAGLTTAHAESSRNYEFSNFDRIEAQAGLKVDVSYGEKHHVEITAKNSDLFEKLIVTQTGNSLVVKRKEDWSIIGLLSWPEKWKSDVQINVTTPFLTDVEASSGAEINIGPFELEQLSLEASSGAELKIGAIKVDKLSLDASSGASLSIAGTCQSLSADASSGADINAKNLNCAQGNVEASSGADINVQLSESVKAEASSGGSVRISGNPQNVEIEQTFGGSININN